MKRMTLEPVLTDVQLEQLAGVRLGDDSYDEVFREDINIYRQDGTLLAAFRKAVIPQEYAKAAYPALRTATKETHNRGLASGKDAVRRTHKKDGTRTNTVDVAYENAVQSGIIGSFDRYVRIPYCRLTAFNLDTPDRFQAALPYIRAIDLVFQQEVPQKYEAQMAHVQRTHPHYIIHNTAFTTVTVNKNWQTAVHKDKGDLRDGFGVLTALRSGIFDGCYLVLPAYRVAFDLGSADVLLFDVHEWHGNTPFKGIDGTYERIACVFYYRERMEKCGSPEEELDRAKHRQPGDPIWEGDPGADVSGDTINVTEPV